MASKYVTAPTGYFVTFNKSLCANAGYTDLYTLVTEKKWTWDVYREIARKATKDTDAADALAVISYLTDNYGEPYNYNETYIWANDDDSFKIVLAVWDAADIQRGLAIRVTGA